MEARNFVLDRTAFRDSLASARLVNAAGAVVALLVMAALLGVAGILPDGEGKRRAIEGALFFLVAGAASTVLAFARMSSNLRVDGNGLTWISGIPVLGFLGLGPKPATLAWSDITAMQIVEGPGADNPFPFVAIGSAVRHRRKS